MKLTLLILGFLMLIMVEILRVYFIMPFPGSQKDETIELAYFLHNNMIYFRLAGLALIAYPFAYFFNRGSQVVKITMVVVFGFYVVVFYMFNYRMLADKMFVQPKNKTFLDSKQTKVLPKQIVLGVSIGTESKAYPIEIIGYHHQVLDEVGGQPVMVTYCTVCRTGRVFAPNVDGQSESFRLVGMDHFNAMFEDSRTKTWWRQVNGEAIVGPLKGKSLPEIQTEQMTLAAWISRHPDTKILQPDSLFREAYDDLRNFDEGKNKDGLQRKDSVAWGRKSWVVGVQTGMDAKAYDWIDLQKLRIINDGVGDQLLVVAANPDSISFHTYNRVVDADTLTFSLSRSATFLTDAETGSLWNWAGQCEEGALKGKVMTPIQSYQENWHSWQTFHPQTTKYDPPKPAL